MSAEQTIILTALPRGVGDPVAGKTQLLLSVFVSPRLKMPLAETNNGETKLGNFADFVDWPKTLEKLHFRVKLDGITVDETSGLARDPKVPPPQSERWKALFSESTPVQAYNFEDEDLSGLPVCSYPVMNTVAFLKERYGNSAANHAAPTRCTPEVLPRIDYPVTGRLSEPEWFGLITTQSREAARPELESQLKAKRAYVAGKTPNPALDFLQVSEFHPTAHYTKDHADRPSSLPEVDPIKTPPAFDFHQMISSLGEYPEILRRLGLIVDLTISLQNIPQQGRISVELFGPGLTAKTITPLTLFEFDAARKLFVAASKNNGSSDFKDGLLRLDRDDLFGIVQVDVDGAAIKAMNYVEQMVRASNNATVDTPGKAALPALRSGGISLVRTNHAAELVNTFDNSKEINDRAEAGQEITLAAEDLLSGYRVDVREVKNDGPKGPWRSLCWRKGTYQFLNASGGHLDIEVEDEGLASAAVTHGSCGTGQGKTPSLKLSEMLFRWAGWSLTVPKDVCGEDTLSAIHGSEVKNSFGFRASFGLPSASDPGAKDKRLPRLRYGNSYQLRVRTVDLAGNSLPSNDATELTTKEAVTYGRFEPVGWPTVILREKVALESKDSTGQVHIAPIEGKEGETVDRLVIRSQVDTDFLKPVVTERHIVPAQINQDIAETHGMFDNEDGTGLSKECFKTIAGKNGKLPEVVPEAEITLPYLPDPLARGVTFLGLPGNDVVQLTYRPAATKWPDLKPFRLQIVGVSAKTPLEPPVFSDKNGERILTVRLPQAEMVRVRLSSYLADYGPEEIAKPSKLLKMAGPILDQLGLWPWIDEWITRQGTNGADIDKWKHIARLLILSGLHWIVTPYREIVMVHAVQQPLLEPLLSIKAQRPEELSQNAATPRFSTFAQLSGEIRCDGKSTGKLDVLAEWKEPLDDPAEPMPHASPTASPKQAGMLDPIAGSAHVVEVPINLPELPINQPDLLPKQLPLLHGKKQIAIMDVAQGVVTLASPELRQEFGDTKYRRVNYTAVATTRFRDYFKQPQTPAEKKEEQSKFARVSKPLPLHVLSSARPAAPKVLYIIPTFRWERSPGKSQRHGGGLRVYMERGWYSSGDGEMLGVVLMRDASASGSPRMLDDKDPLKPYVSQWGADPLRVSAGTNGLLAPENFTHAVTTPPESGNLQTTELSLDELPDGTRVSVAPHAVAYDEVRRLWYCDIEINPGNSYYPFVRLALARYQPNSVAGVHLSRVSLADFVQLTPERTLSLTFNAAFPTIRKITVTGPTYSHYKNINDQTVKRGTVMTVTMERRESADELSWKPLSDKPAELLHNAEQQSWLGIVNLPNIPGASGSKPLRLVIRELETFLEGDPLQERLVYAEILNL
jgi:hypothetical protein